MVVIDPPRSVAGKILSEGQRLERTVVWHPGVLTRFGMKEFEGYLKRLDYLITNEHEIERFTNVKGLKAAIETVARVAPNTKIIVTLGKKGAAFYEKGKLTKVGSVSLAKLGRKVVNTTGSGDAFVGAFAAYKVLGKMDGEALRLANMAGALKASRTETRGSPGRHELEEACRKYFG
jgi:ribokinase